MAARWVRLNYTEPIDKKNVPNFSNLVDNLKTINYDPKREYTLPWQSGAIGIGYNPKKTGRELKSVKDLFDPKFKGKVTMLSEMRDTMGLIMLEQGVDISELRSEADRQIPMWGRGRIDHVGLQAASPEAFATIRERLNTWVANYYDLPLIGELLKEGFASILVLFLVFRPQGLFGERVAEKA